MSKAVKIFRKGLPLELRNKAKVSISYQDYFRIASEHLQSIFGIYAEPEYCLNAYYK